METVNALISIETYEYSWFYGHQHATSLRIDFRKTNTFKIRHFEQGKATIH